jgi:hypothetical protein
MSSFTYIIRSNDKEILIENTSSCHLRLVGLPQQYKYFECEVVQFYVNLTEIVELRADSSLGFQNGVDSKGTFKTCAFLNGNSTSQGQFKFIVDNFNGRFVKFELYDLNKILVNSDGSSFNLPWILVLNMRGIEN